MEEQKPEIMDSASVESEKRVQMNIQASYGGEGRRLVTAIDDSAVKETKEILENGSNFISGCEINDICSNIKEMQDLVEYVREEPRNDEQESFLTFSEAHDSSTDLKVESVFVADEKEVADISSFAEEKQDTVENELESISQSQNLVEMTSRTTRSENSLERVLAIDEKQNVIKHEVGSILGAQNHEFGEGAGDSSVIKEILEVHPEISDKQRIVEIQDTVENDGQKMNNLNGSKVHVENSMRSDGTHELPIIFPTSLSKTGNFCGRKERGSVNFGKKGLGSCSESVKQEFVEKKEKPSKRRSNAMKKNSEMNGKQNVCPNKGNESKRCYSRNEMEALQFVNAEGQRKTWNEIYLGLEPVVAKELDGLAVSKSQKQGRKCTDHHQLVGKKKEIGPILGEVCSQNMEHIFKEQITGEMFSQNMEDNFKEPNPLHLSCDDEANCEDNEYGLLEEECDEDKSSDEEYETIQRPAFVVEGDPDFESGPPQDGLEYLKRVRWEAAQIPKVKVAKLDRSRINNEQTVYMPKIPDIAKSPQHLLPSKLWEDAFLTDFSELRLVLSSIESSNIQNSNNLLLSLPIKDDNSSRFSGYPTVSTILRMDSVSRAVMLRNHIRSLEAMSTLSRNNCAWVFALCAALDTPLDADTSASLRCLLRQCANLRAGKSESDDELVMLNILMTISGRYFGQLEN